MQRQPHRALAALSLTLVTALACTRNASDRAGQPLTDTDLDPAAYGALLGKLASDELQGRGVRTEGNRRATELLVESFREAGLRPGGKADSYLRCFEHPVALRTQSLSLHAAGEPVPSSAISPAAYSSADAFDGGLVFAGYGIHAPELGYDDYASLNPKGKVLVLLRFEPREKDPESPFNGERPSRFSDLRKKVFEARTRGAVAVLLVVPPDRKGELDKRLPALAGAQPESAAGLPVLHVLPSLVDGWLKAKGTDLASEVAAIDSTFKSTPRFLGHARGDVRIAREQRELCNVVGVLPGHGVLAEEAVVIGAHFDHLGYGGSGSMAPGVKQVHNGADDNASGTAGLVSLARALSARSGKEPRRALVFAAFNAEEVGLAGSSRYVEDPPVPISKTVAMLNLDMIGRLRDNTLTVLGTESGDRWQAWLDAEVKATGLVVSALGDGYGPSDQTPFYAAKVPVLHFFTGAHEDHHKPSDDADKINVSGAMKILRLVAGTARRAATSKERIAYQETSSGPPLAGDSRGFGSWLGTVPDFTAMSPGAAGGVKISDVSKGGPAQKAGMRGGDRIVAMAGRQIENLYDMSFVLRDHHPGDVIAVEIEREGKRIELAATLGAREKHPAGQGGMPGKHGHGHHGEASPEGAEMNAETLLYPGEEKHLRNVRQLTFGGENAEGYFSPDGSKIVFQARDEGVPCDRIYSLDLTTGKKEQISSGKGRTTCAYFSYPKGDGILYSSTHLAGDQCPPAPDHGHGRILPVFESYDIFLKGPGATLVNLTESPGYDAEATACFHDGRIIFTSDRDGDLELYIMDPNAPDRAPKRITNTAGYDGGAYFSPDCKRLVWRAARPQGEALASYQELLKKHLVKPSVLEIYVANADGSGARQVTQLDAATFAPYFLPDSRRVIFASNFESRRNFDLFVIDAYAEDPGKTVERVTFSPVFESFPMFSPDGRHLVFASNRNAKKRGETNLFIAEWVGG